MRLGLGIGISNPKAVDGIGGGGVAPIDPADVANLTLYYKAGLIADGGSQDKAIGWYSNYPTNSKGLITGHSFSITKIINGIELWDQDDASKRFFETEFFNPSDPEECPFTLRGVFTNISIYEIVNDTTSSSFWNNNQTLAEPDKWGYINVTYDGSTKRFVSKCRALSSGGIIVSPGHSVVSNGEIVMVVTTFDYTTKTMTCTVRGVTASGIETNYDAGATGMNFSKLKTMSSNPSNNCLDMLTIDRIVPDEELNGLGAYFSNRWDQEVWTNL